MWKIFKKLMLNKELWWMNSWKCLVCELSSQVINPTSHVMLNNSKPSRNKNGWYPSIPQVAMSLYLADNGWTGYFCFCDNPNSVSCHTHQAITWSHGLCSAFFSRGVIYVRLFKDNFDDNFFILFFIGQKQWREKKNII